MNPILLDIPERIEGHRIYLRTCKPGDGPMVHDAIIASKEELKAWMPWAHLDQTVEDTEENLRRAQAEFILREDIRLYVMRKEDNVFLGSTGLHRMNWEAGRFEIGYWMDARYTKQGYMTEAVELLTYFAFNELKANRVEIRCDTRNLDSRRIPEKLGYILEGILRNDNYDSTGSFLRDTCIFSKLREEFQLKNGL